MDLSCVDSGRWIFK